MATASVRSTPDDLLSITDRLMPELIDGQLVEREPMGQRSDAVAALMVRLIGNFVSDRALGLVNGSQGSYQIFPDDPDKVRIPDISFTSRERLPRGAEEDGHGKVAPDLIIEVISQNDRVLDVAMKVQDFLAAGVRLVWVVNPYVKHVQTYRSTGPGSTLRVGDILEGEDVLPGFRCPVAKLFEI